MKKITMLIGSLLIGSLIYAQQNPTGNGGNSKEWHRGGNNAAPFGQGGTDNIFGTMWNSPIYTYTNGQPRTRLNGTFTAGGATIQPTINGVNYPAVNTSGYFGISANGYFANNTPIALLHLQGDNNTPFSPGGWRRWMKTGMFVSEHSDAMYVGMKPVPNSTNRSNAIINWSDDPWSGGPGVDKLSFVFTQANPNGNGTGTNPINGSSLDGYEFMMMAPSTTVYNSQGTGEGTIGVGPVFTDALPPQSRVHMNAEESLNNWLQITNQSGTGQAANDGLRIGILGHNNPLRNGNALIYNQENRHLLFSTSANTNNVNPNNTQERMRVTRIGAPTNIAGGGYGNNNPAGLGADVTRVSISHDPANPVTRPLSLLHLGYNTGAVGSSPASTDGWRNWMDIGTFTSNGTDNVYIGLKQETGALPASDRNDAVINWGDNDGTNPLNGPDNLRFIFTSTQTSIVPGNTPATTNNGLETGRFSPAAATTMGSNFGMMGIGDWTTAYNTGNPIDAKLDIDGDLRIRTVTKDTNNSKLVLVIDSADHNRVHWLNIDSIGGNVTANNGVSVNATSGAVQLGVPCQDSLGNDNIPAILANALTEDRVVAIGDFNLWFATYTGQKSGVGIGGQPASTNFCTTGNTLEVSANGSSKYGATSSSGLRFTHLTSDSLTVSVGTNGVVNTKVLTVDQDGDVVLVDAVGGGNVTADNGLSIDPLNANNIQLGQEVILGTLSFNGSAELLNDREIPLNGHDLIFSSTNNGFTTPGIERISIGLNPFTPGAPVFPTNPQNYVSSASAKLNLFNTTEETGAHFLTYMDPLNVGFAPPQYSGIKGTVYGLHNDKSIIGVLGQGLSFLTGVVVEGVRGEAFGNGVNIGVKGISFTANKTAYGGFFRSHSATGIPCLNGDNYGIWAEANGSSVSNIAIYATIDPTNPCNAADNWAGWFNGNVNVLGSVTQTSDANLKNNINSIGLNDAREIINQLNPVTFNYDNSVNTRLALPNGLKYGLIAQEVEIILPEVVYENTLPAERDSMGNVISNPYTYKTLDYKDFVPILIAGMKEQQSNLDNKDSIINNLEERLAYLENCINRANICIEGNKSVNSELNNTVNQKSVELTNNNSIILDQNMPNPFAENTVINYIIPQEVGEAKLLFYDLNGRIIKELIIEERGESKLTVYGNNLKTGVYTYSLIADGQLIATKKMVKK